MSDLKTTVLLPALEKMLEFTIRTILRSTGAKAVVIVMVHEDATIQSSASVAPGMEKRIVSGMRSLAARIETGEGVRVEMSDKFKN